MKIKTSELSGAALDWAVANCEDHTPIIDYYDRVNDTFKLIPVIRVIRFGKAYDPSMNWSLAGPIIEQLIVKGYSISCSPLGSVFVIRKLGEIEATGKTLPIAAMRCYVASKLGDEVDVPAELVSIE